MEFRFLISPESFREVSRSTRQCLGGAATLAFHIAGMVEDGDALPVLRSIEDLRKDRQFRKDARNAVIVGVPIDLPTKAVRVNVTLDEVLLGAIDRAAQAAGESRSGYLAMAARERLMRGDPAGAD